MAQIQLITGDDCRRRWTDEEKSGILAQVFTAGVPVREIARRLGISTGLLYTWRKKLWKGSTHGFAQVMAVAEPSPARPCEKEPVIEIEINGCHVKIPAMMPPALAAAVISALVQR